MKKFIVLLLLGIFLTGCAESNVQETDYSDYLFTDVSWTRESGYDIETIRFNADGSFYYSCSCGNPVNDSDLCEGYTYNDETKEISFDYIETTEEMITTIKVVKVSEDILELDFNGETRIFEKEN